MIRGGLVPGAAAGRVARRGSLLIDIIVSLAVFVGALATFLALSSDKDVLLADNLARGRALAAVERQLALLGEMSLADIERLHNSSFEVEGFRGGKASGRIEIEPGPAAGILRADVSLEWPASDGHPRRIVMSRFLARHPLRSGDER